MSKNLCARYYKKSFKKIDRKKTFSERYQNLTEEKNKK